MTDAKNVVRKNFGNSAENYASASIHAQGEDLQWLVEAHPLTGNERVLDAGTGAGHAAFAFAPYVQFVEGVDITPLMLEQARKGAAARGLENIRFSQADVEELPHEENTFDLVVSRWCAHHYPDIRMALAQIARVLKPGGIFLLVDSVSLPYARVDMFLNTLEMLRDTGHVRNYTIAEWLDYLERVGLHGMVLREWNLRLDGESWVQRIQTPTVYVAAIKQLLRDADADLRAALHITEESAEAGWGFDLPSFLLQAVVMK